MLFQDQKFDSINSNNSKKFDAVVERIQQVKNTLDLRIDQALALEDLFKQNKLDLMQVQDTMLRTKTDLAQQTTDVKALMSQQTLKHEAQE